MILSLAFSKCYQHEPGSSLGHSLLQRYFIVYLAEIWELSIWFDISIYHYASQYQVFCDFGKFLSSDVDCFVLQVLLAWAGLGLASYFDIESSCSLAFIVNFPLIFDSHKHSGYRSFFECRSKIGFLFCFMAFQSISCWFRTIGCPLRSNILRSVCPIHQSILMSLSLGPACL